MPQMNGEWIVVGSSPGAAEWLPAVRERYPDAVTLTTNRGIKLFTEERPTVYFFGDEYNLFPDTFEEYREAGRATQKQGTHIVGLTRSEAVLDAWDIRWMDEFLNIEVGCWRPWKFIPGKYTAAHLSGLMCLQYALNKGAAAVHLIGMEGYADSVHYFDGGPDSQNAKDAKLTADTIGPFTQAVVNACPTIGFNFYGDLKYPVTGENVTLHKDLSEWNSNSSDAGEDSGRETSEICPMARQTS